MFVWYECMFGTFLCIYSFFCVFVLIFFTYVEQRMHTYHKKNNSKTSKKKNNHPGLLTQSKQLPRQRGDNNVGNGRAVTHTAAGPGAHTPGGGGSNATKQAGIQNPRTPARHDHRVGLGTRGNQRQPLNGRAGHPWGVWVALWG